MESGETFVCFIIMMSWFISVVHQHPKGKESLSYSGKFRQMNGTFPPQHPGCSQAGGHWASLGAGKPGCHWWCPFQQRWAAAEEAKRLPGAWPLEPRSSQSDRGTRCSPVHIVCPTVTFTCLYLWLSEHTTHIWHTDFWKSAPVTQIQILWHSPAEGLEKGWRGEGLTWGQLGRAQTCKGTPSWTLPLKNPWLSQRRTLEPQTALK